MDITLIAPLFNILPSSPLITAFIASLEPSSSPRPEIRLYPDTIFHNHHSLGLSLCFLPSITPPIISDSTQWKLNRLDIFNPPCPPIAPPGRRSKWPWDGYLPPPLPITVRFPTTTVTLSPGKPNEESSTIERPAEFSIQSSTTGREFVQHFGEPSKKGGGSNAFIPPFLEWNDVELVGSNGEKTHIGIMVELRNPGSHEVLTEERKRTGAGGVWDRAADWEWAGLKVFDPVTSPNS